MNWLENPSLWAFVLGATIGYIIARWQAAQDARELEGHWFDLAIRRINGQPAKGLPKPLADAIVRKAELVARENARLGRALADIVNDTKADGGAARERARKALEGRDAA